MAGHRRNTARSTRINADQLLEWAVDLVASRRRPPVDVFERVAVRRAQVLRSKVMSAQVGLLLIDLKLARLAHDPRHLDSRIDVANCAAWPREVTR